MECPLSCRDGKDKPVVLELHEPGNMSHYWECPKCGTRVFPGKIDDMDAEKLFNQEIEDKKKLCKFGGSSSPGRKKEAKKKKPDLFGEV